ncbi:hypothetical protein ACFQJD_09780 [Haloplanus sp. GCM10025708]|uniref:hypothetical protein n=1 Tax=Haloplanus sp. GCM10025708 TaxID=3252679 RepID=UPI0036077898
MTRTEIDGDGSVDGVQQHLTEIGRVEDAHAVRNVRYPSPERDDHVDRSVRRPGAGSEDANHPGLAVAVGDDAVAFPRRLETPRGPQIRDERSARRGVETAKVVLDEFGVDAGHRGRSDSPTRRCGRSASGRRRARGRPVRVGV